MSKFELSRVCRTFKGMSNFQVYVMILRVCHTFKGMLIMSHFQMCQKLDLKNQINTMIDLS